MDIRRMVVEGKTTDEILNAVRAEIEAEQTKKIRTKETAKARERLADAFVSYGIALGVVDSKEAAEDKKRLETEFISMEKAIEAFEPVKMIKVKRADRDMPKKDVKREGEKTLPDDEIIRKILSGLV